MALALGFAPALAPGFAPALALASGGEDAFVKRGPLAGLSNFGDSVEVLTIWNDDLMVSGYQVGEDTVRQLFDLDASYPPLPSMNQAGSKIKISDDLAGDQQGDTARADLDGDGREEMIFAREVHGSEAGQPHVKLEVMGLDSETGGFVTHSADIPQQHGFANLHADPNPWPDARPHRVLHVAAGQLDDDIGHEVVLAYWADDATIEILVYDTDDTLVLPIPVGLESNSPSMSASSPVEGFERRSAVFAIAVADLDGDLVDEIAVAVPTDPIACCDADRFGWSRKMAVSFYGLAEDAGEWFLEARGGGETAALSTAATASQQAFVLDRVELVPADLPPSAPVDFVGIAPKKLVLVMRVVRDGGSAARGTADILAYSMVLAVEAGPKARKRRASSRSPLHSLRRSTPSCGCEPAPTGPCPSPTAPCAPMRPTSTATPSTRSSSSTTM